MIQILSRKYFSEWANGTAFSSNTSDFATHLKGSVGEKLKFVTTVKAALITVADTASPFYTVNGNKLQRQDGSWIKDGFAIGQSCSLIKDYTGKNSGNPPAVEWTDTIIAISDSELEFSSIGNPNLHDDHALVCANKFGALIYSYGLIENNASDSFLSPYTNDKQTYYYGSIDTTTPTEHTMTVGGGVSASKSWKSGDATVKYLSSSNPFGLAVNYEHQYEVTQIFVISPVFVEAFLDSLDNGTQPDDYIGENSLKHIAEYEFRSVLTNPNTTSKFTDTAQLGSVGWFNENYNGFNDIYSVTGIYKDSDTLVSVDGLQLKRKTTVSGTIAGTGFANTDKLGAYFYFAAPVATYSAKQDSFQDTFLWDSLIATMSAGAVTSVGSERIKRFTLTYFSATRIDYEIDIEFSDDEISLINPDSLDVVSDKYFIGIQVGNTNTTDTSNKVILEIDFNEFVVNNDEEGLVTFSQQRFYNHAMDDTAGGHTDYKGWKQDGFLYGSSILLNKALGANLRALQVRLVAYNTVTSETFDLQKYIYDLSDIVQVGTYQKLTIDSERGFRLAQDDQFNQVYLNFDNPVGNYQNIEIKLGIKFDWQSWISLPGADTIFYDNALDSKGMGKDASRYSMNEDYEIRLMVDADVFANLLTRYTDMSPDLDIYGWGLDDADPANWAALIETFDLDDNDLGGAILENADTKFKVTWTPLSGSTSSFNNQWAIHRIESEFASGYNDVDEFSSIRDSRVGNLLKPLIGETYLKVTDTGTAITTECLIDYTKLSGRYNLSCRLSRYADYARYNIARDIKLYSENGIIYFNCPTNGIAETNSLRIAETDGDYNILYEEAVALSASYAYQNWKMVVSGVITNGKPNFYAVCFTGLATALYEFIYNGTIYLQTQIFSSNIGGDGLTFIQIDPALEPNGKPYIWFGNRDSNISGDRGCKHAYWDGAAWQFTDFKCYSTASPQASHLNHLQGVQFYGSGIYLMNYDNPPQAAAYNKGKIAKFTQTSGSTTDPADRTNFANYTLSNNIYINSADTENEDGTGDVSDLAWAVGFELLDVDENTNPIFLIAHDVSLGARHFSRIYANTPSPTADSDWTIETPMAFTNLLYGSPEALRGQANGTYQSGPLQRKNQCHLLIVSGNDFITGHASAPYWVRYKINDWTGGDLNDWWVYAPNDPTFDFTTGNILV